MIEKVVSGGQTGADRAGLDAAIEAGIPVGGYCPKGRIAEDGVIPECYSLTELTRRGYPARTEKNVAESDGTLILNIGRVSGGTKTTVEFARKDRRPSLVVQLDRAPQVEDAVAWLQHHAVKTVNIAGPRESKRPGIHQAALSYLRRLFTAS